MHKINPTKLRRVKKSDVQVSQFSRPSGLSVCLECWRFWMWSDDRDLSASRMKLGQGYEHDTEREDDESNPYDDQRKADYKIGEATGAMIEELKPSWRWAIHKKMGMADVWHYAQLDFLITLANAEDALEEKLRRHIATATQFL